MGSSIFPSLSDRFEAPNAKKIMICENAKKAFILDGAVCVTVERKVETAELQCLRAMFLYDRA